MSKSCDKCDFETADNGVLFCPNDGEKLRSYYGDEGERVGIDVGTNFPAGELAGIYDLSLGQARQVLALLRGLSVIIEFKDGKAKIVDIDKD